VYIYIYIHDLIYTHMHVRFFFLGSRLYALQPPQLYGPRSGQRGPPPPWRPAQGFYFLIFIFIFYFFIMSEFTSETSSSFFCKFFFPGSVIWVFYRGLFMGGLPHISTTYRCRRLRWVCYLGLLWGATVR